MNFLKFSQDFFKLRQFYFVAKAGSLLGAATMLNMGHSSLSTSMKKLEERLKTKLFKRESSGLKLTVDGERLFEYAAKMFEEGEAFLKNFCDNDKELQGEIKIITTPAEAETILTHYLLPFLQENPSLSIPIQTASIDFDVQGADVAIRTFIPGRSDLEQLPLRNVEMKLWSSIEYIKKFGLPKSEKDLDNHQLLVFKQHNLNFYFDFQNQNHWILQVGSHSNYVRKAFYQITSHEGLHHAVSKGYGIALLPEEYVKIKGSQLIEILPSIKKPEVALYFIYKKNLLNSKRIIALYHYLLECFEEINMKKNTD